MDEPNKIVLEADTHLIDVEARDLYSKLSRRIDTINERTKSHTLRLRSIEYKIKKWESTQKNEA